MAENMDMKIHTDIPERYRIDKSIDRDDDHTPTDDQCFLFNKRMHEWNHHKLSFHQFTNLDVRQVLPEPWA